MQAQSVDYNQSLLTPFEIPPEEVHKSDSRIYQLFILTNFVAATALGVYCAPITFTAAVLTSAISYCYYFRQEFFLDVQFCQQNLNRAQTATLQRLRSLEIQSVNKSVQRRMCVKIEMTNLSFLWIGPFACCYLSASEPLFLFMRASICLLPGIVLGAVLTEQINRIRALNACRAIQTQISTLPTLPQ